jgi:hypothetical protein
MKDDWRLELKTDPTNKKHILWGRRDAVCWGEERRKSAMEQWIGDGDSAVQSQNSDQRKKLESTKWMHRDWLCKSSWKFQICFRVWLDTVK